MVKSKVFPIFILAPFILLTFPVFLLAQQSNANISSNGNYNLQIAHFGAEEGLKSIVIQEILKDDKGMLWLSGGSGVTTFDGRDFDAFTASNGRIPFQGIRELAVDETGYLWLLQPCKHQKKCTGKLVFLHSTTHEVLTVEERFGNQFPIAVKDLLELAMDEHKTVFFHSNDKNYKWSAAKGFEKSDFQWETENKLIVQDKKTNLTWNLEDNIYTVNHPTKGLVYDLKELHPAFKQNIYVNTVYFDEFGTTWIGSNYGLFAISLQPRLFNAYLDIPTDDIFVPEKTYVTSISELPNQTMLFSTNKGIYALKDGKPKLLPIDIQKKPVIFMEQFYKKQLLMANNKGLYSMNISNETTSLVKFPKEIGWVNDLILCQEGKVLLGTNEGIYLFDMETKAFEPAGIPKPFHQIQEAAVNHFFKKENNIWISTEFGIYQYQIGKGLMDRFYKNQETGGFPLTACYSIFEAKDGTIWVGSKGGLMKWELGTPNGERYLIDGENRTGRVYAIEEDEKGNLWWSTRKRGVFQFFIKNRATEGYTIADGLPYSKFRLNAAHKSQSGHIYFGSHNGVAVFDPSHFSEEKEEHQTDLVILNFEQFHQNTKKVSNETATLLKKQKIILKPNDGFFSIKVSLPDYANAKLFRYRYKIDGLDDVWQEGWENRLRVSGLSYGHYTMTIQGIFPNGQFSNSLVIPIQVLRPFYRQWWFVILSIFMILSGVFYFFRQRTKQYEQKKTELENAVQERTAQIRKDKQTIEEQAEELKALDNLKSHFFANVSHELRTPLTLMLAPIENSLKNNQLTNRDYTNLLMAQRNGQRLNKMINEILDLTKLEAGKLEVQNSKVVWYNFLKKIVANFESLANKKQIHFTFQYEEKKTLQVDLDVNKTEIILVNLLSNAFKFTPNKGDINLKATSKEHFLHIELEDTGKGIHPDDLPNVFNRFYQTKRKEAATEGGTGIGLALSKEFVQLMKGSLNVQSELGKGSTFTLQIPKIEIISQMSTEEAEQMTNSYQEAQGNNNEFELVKSDTNLESPITILLVEDNSDMQAFIQSLLVPKYHVITAENGKEALEQLADSNGALLTASAATAPDNYRNCQLIISDVMMPIMNGYQLLETLKSNEAYRHIPVIMLTARGGIQDKLKALRIGVDDYMLKPFNEDELLARIENLLINAKNRQSLVAVETHEIIEEEIPSTISDEDQKWLTELEELVIGKLSNFDFSVTDLAQSLLTNRWQLNNHIKSLTGLTAQQYIQETRLNQARTLLENGTVKTVKAASLAVGMKSIKYFSKQFKTRFGKSPSAYIV